VITAAAWSSAAGPGLTAQGASPAGQGGELAAQGASPAGQGGGLAAQVGSLAGQGGGLAGQGGPLAGQGGCAGSRDGWRAAQPGSPGGGSPGAAAEAVSFSAPTCVAHPAQYRGDPPSGFPQFGQNRMGAPWLRPTPATGPAGPFDRHSGQMGTSMDALLVVRKH
jgi:hypothetical protein